MVQIIVDNFDTDISSPNGKSSTHSLAMIITQLMSRNDHNETRYIPRLKYTAKYSPIQDFEIEAHYTGPPKCLMPKTPAPEPMQEMELRKSVSDRRANEIDLAFFKDVLNEKSCPEYNGYNTRLCRDEGQSVRPKTKVVYLPLIDKTPSDPSTTEASLIKAQTISLSVGQEFVVFTADQQLYRVALNVIWNSPDKFSDICLRLGGMHFLMSYCSCIGLLMSASGFEEVLVSTFGGVKKMLTGKKFPNNVRAFRLLTEEVLRSVLLTHDVQQLE